jgi:hypothetical protein
MLFSEAGCLLLAEPGRTQAPSVPDELPERKSVPTPARSGKGQDPTQSGRSENTTHHRFSIAIGHPLAGVT